VTRKTRTGAGNPPPTKKTSARRNSQRLTLMSPHERAAADSGGMVPRLSGPALDRIAKRLTNEGRFTFDAPAVLREVEAHAGRIALFARSESARLSPAEIARQGRDTVAVIRELLTRLDNMHPELDAHVGATVWRSRGIAVHPGEWLRPDLLLIAAALGQASDAVDKRPTRTGPAPTVKGSAVAALAETLRERSEPRMSKKAADALARELIELAIGG
jgi:hypothetical protein